MDTIKRLEELLDQKDARIEALESEIEKLENQLREAESGWCLHTKLDRKQELPVPRLEIVYRPLGEREGYEWSSYETVYRMVYRHLVGDIMSVPLGRTEICGHGSGPPLRDGRLRLPFRDGAHICSDMAHLRLPGFAVCGDHVDDLTALAGKPEARWL